MTGPPLLTIAVVDDDPRSREGIAVAVRAHLKGRDCLIVPFADAGSFLAARQRFDIAILDIIMPKKSGLEAALELYARDRNCRIIFLTVSPDYAIHGYQVNALDYLLKPLDAQALGRALDRGLARTAGVPATIILREGRDLKKVAVSDILYCQSDDKRVLFHGSDFTISCRGKLDEFKARLPGHFVQTHNRFLVNLDRVLGLNPEAMRLDNGREAPISRAYKKSASAAYFDHVAAEARKA